MPAGRIGPYVQERLVRDGSLGEIWASRDPETGARVLLRVVEAPGRKLPGAWTRVIEALPGLRSLEHPRIARILGVAEGDGKRAIVEEYLEGPTLARLLGTKAQPLKREAVYRIFMDIASALEHAAEYDMAHLHLHPHHVVIGTDAAGRARARVDGFGVGRAWGPSLLPGDIQPHDAVYLAPEQWHPMLPVGSAADVYATGVMLYLAVTRQVPFFASTSEAIARAHLGADLVAPSALDASLPWHLDRTIQAALTRHPADRVRDAHELWLLLAGGRCGAVVREGDLPRLTPRPSVQEPGRIPRPADLQYLAHADTADHRFGDAPDRQGDTLPAFDAPRSGPGRLSPEDCEAPTGLIRLGASPLAAPPDFSEEDWDAPTGLIEIPESYRTELQAEFDDLSLADTEDVPLLRPSPGQEIDLGTTPPRGLPAASRVAMAETEPVPIPEALRRVSLDEEPDEEPQRAPTLPASPVPRFPTPVPTPQPIAEEDDAVGTAETAAIQIPDSLRNIDLGDDFE